MRTPRTPRDGAKRDRLPKIGEETVGPASAEDDEGDSVLGQSGGGGDSEWENVDLNDSGLEDTPSKPAPEGSPADSGPQACEGAAQDLAACAVAEAGAHGGTEASAGPTAPNADAGGKVSDEERQEPDEESEPKKPPSSGHEVDWHSDTKEPGQRVKTLKDYAEGRGARSPRGADLEQITVRAFSVLAVEEKYA
jgi:hypothetical protein